MIVGTFGVMAGAAVLLLGLGGAAIEYQYRRRPGNALDWVAGNWRLMVCEPQRYQIVGRPELINRTCSLEIMVLEVKPEPTLLSGGSLTGVSVKARIKPSHPDAEPRSDDYWFGYIVKVGKAARMDVEVDIQGADLTQLKALWVRIHYVTYGPQGRIPKTRHVIVPLKFPNSDEAQSWRPLPMADILPIPTHLLTQLDDPVSIIKRYVLPHSQPDDIVTIGETPVAIMQGRLRHPTDVKPGWLAKRLCYYFMPTSSLATACGMQTLVDIVGPWRVLLAFLVGSIAKILGKPGVFYQLAGEQARLIDDVTGTLPPFDQFIVLGPKSPQKVVQQIYQETRLHAAIVDVNDLKAVKILAATPEVNFKFLEKALIDNPAGNADEQTPLVLIRPRIQS